MNNFLKGLFLSNEQKLKLSIAEVEENRKKTKENFAKNLKEKLFFTDEEIAELFYIIDGGYMKMDMLQQTTSYENYGLISSQQLEMEFLKIEKEMMKAVETKMKEIMAEKVRKAKEYFGKD